MKILVIDVGGTEIKYALMSESRDIFLHDKIVTPRDSVAKFVDAIEGIHNTVRDEAEGISICLPGIIDSEKGVCISGGSLHYNIGQPIRQMIEQRCKTKVYVENDGKCAAMAEYWQGALRGTRCGVVILLGTAVAGGIIIDGKLLKGPHYSAGEFSYLCADATVWGEQRAVVGKMCSAVEMVGEIKRQFPKENIRDGIDAFRLIRQNRPAACEVYQKMLRNVAQQIYNIQIMLDPDVIAIGGGISREKQLVPDLFRAVEQFYDEGFSSGRNTFLPRVNLKNCVFFNNANLLGALYHYLVREKCIN